MAQRIQLRRDTAANWTSVNTILAQGELGLETDTNKLKFGDGSTPWSSLSYFSGTLSLAQLATLTQTATADTVSLDADTWNFYDAVDTALKKITWANIKATLKTYFDTLYQTLTTVISGNTTAANDGIYHVTASATFTDPSPVEGKGYTVFVRNGTATVGSTPYATAGTVIKRVYHSGAWASYISLDSSALIGAQDLYIPTVAMWPRTTSGCAALAKTEMTTSLVNIQSLDFDQTTSEYAQFTISLPRNWNNGTVTAKFYWTAASGSGTVTWGIQGGAYSNDDALTVALGTAQTVTDTLIATNDLHISDPTSAITLAGTPADADFLAFQIYRDISDTLSADAKLLGVVITLTTDAAVAS